MGLLLFDFVGHPEVLKTKHHIVECLRTFGELLLVNYFTGTVSLGKIGSGRGKISTQVTVRAACGACFIH